MFCKPILYFTVCLGIRSLIAHAFHRAPGRYLPIMGVLALIIAIGFMMIYLLGWRQGSVVETGKACKVWWNDLRPIHAALYLLSGLAALKRQRSTYLWMDVWIGIGYYVMVKNGIYM